MKSTLGRVSIYTAKAALVVLFLTIAMVGFASAKDKVAKDLKDKINGNSGSTRVDVIVISTVDWTTTQDTAVTNGGGQLKKSFTNFKKIRIYNLPLSAINSLANRIDLDYFLPDREMQQQGHLTTTTGTSLARSLGGSTVYDGTGVGIAIIDSGIDPNHWAFRDNYGNSRIKVNVDFTGEGRTDDPYGHGTHVASIAAGNNSVSNGAYEGIASNANILNLRALNSFGIGSMSSVLTSLDWVYTNRANTTYNIKVVNMSLGTLAVDSYRNDPLCLAVRQLVDAGIVVVVSAGNRGKDISGNKVYGLISSPGNEPSAITVGATNTYGTDVRSDDVMASYSSHGPTRSFYTDDVGVKHYDNLVKPDLVAPGNKVIDAQAPNNYLVTMNPTLDMNVSGNSNKDQMMLSGTSMASPVVAGTVALMFQANSKLTPNIVKMALMFTAQPIRGVNNFEQGTGQLNSEGAVRLAKAVRTDLTATTALGANLLTSATPPTANSTIVGENFSWGGGVIADHTFFYGANLMTKYQKVYALGKLLGDGTLETTGVLVSDTTLMSSGVLVSDNILINNGVLVSDGYPFLSTGVLVSDGVLLSDGVLISDGVLVGDGVLISDGVLVSDSIRLPLFATVGYNALKYGDATAAMSAQTDISPNAPSTLTATTVSNSQINLAWTDNSTDEQGFRVERSTDGVNFTQIATVSANVRTFSSTSLSRNTRYYYRVRAYNGTNNSFYTTNASATTLR